MLPGCLQALKKQTCPSDSFEVIVVDDESTDETVAQLEDLASTWSNEGDCPALRLVKQDWHGAGAARNRGVVEARGEVILFTDADCEPLDDWVTRMIEPLNDPAVSAVAGAYLTRQPSIIARLAQAEFEERYRYVDQHASIDIAFTHSAAFRKDVFVDSGGFDERMPNNSDDLELSYRIATSGHRIVFARQGLVYHRHPATLLDYMRKKFGRGYWRTLVFKRYPEKLVVDSYTPPLLKAQIFLVGLAVLLLVASLFGPIWLAYGGALALVAVLVTGIPFARRIRGSLKIKAAAPFFLLAQATAIAAGVVFGTFDRIEHYDVGGRRR